MIGLWLDVEDLFEYAEHNPRPSGIQRLMFEVCKTLQTLHGASGAVHFVRHDRARASFRIVSWPEIAALFDGLTLDRTSTPRPHAPETRRTQIARSPSAARQAALRYGRRLPLSVRMPAAQALRSQATALEAWLRLARAVLKPLLARETWRGAWRAARGQAPRERRLRSAGADSFAAQAKPGDILLVLGAPWSNPNAAALVTSEVERRSLRLALLLYDLIPLRAPEWCDRGLSEAFRDWFETMAPRCFRLFAISRAAAFDVHAYFRERGLTLPAPVAVVPIGSGFGEVANATPAPRSARLPAAGTYALIVSTIEARKNHALLFRVWRRMLHELSPEQVPTLVFAGRRGWRVDDLMHQIANTDYLGGKLVVLENPSDVEIVALYRGCLFTLFPSFFEGWGLPVTESLAFGKPCIVSDATSIPEAGGALARYFDPDNAVEAHAAIRAAIDDPAGLAAWEAKIQREFRPTPWNATVEALLAGLDHPLASPCPAADTPAPILPPLATGARATHGVK